MQSSPAPLAKTDRRGFPEGDPRSKGGSELDIGLQVGPLMWRWPSSWPFEDERFSVTNEASASDYFSGKASAAEACAGEDAQRALDMHMQRHLLLDSDILDLGAGPRTALPDEFETKSITGVSATEAEMAGNSRLTERVIMDLNTVSDTTPLPFPDKSFDVVLMTFSVEFMTQPRELFREIYRVLREEGICIVAFSDKDAYAGFEDKQCKFWSDMNDAQKMYVVGAYFQYSSGGWSQLKGYDLTADSAKQGVLGLGRTGSPMFVVSSVRATMPSEGRPLRYMQAKLWDAKHMLPDDRRLAAERMYSIFDNAKSMDEQNNAMEALEKLDSIYEILKVMNTVLPTPTMAMFASNLAPTWGNSEAEKTALKQGLGLETPSEDFWMPIGKLSSELSAEEKIWLLVDLVPTFAQPAKAALHPELPAVIERTQEHLKEKCPDLSNADVQLLSVDLAMTDYMMSDDPAGFLKWVEEDLGPLELLDMLQERKNFKETAKQKAMDMGIIPESPS